MKKVFSALAINLALLSLVSCGKSKQLPATLTETESSALHAWYYFSDGNFKKAEKPSLVPQTVFKPWTESVRISSLNSLSSVSSDTSVPEAFAIVNRIGILSFKSDKIELLQDTEFFSNSTAGNLVFYNNTPVFSVFRSTFFNEKSCQKSTMHPFLIQFNPEQKVFYPIITVENLGLSSTSEVTDYVWDGQFWTLSIKDTGSEKITFSYLTFQPKESLTSIYPSNAKDSVYIRDTSVDSFRNIRKPENFRRAPERLQRLLDNLPSDLSYTMEVFTTSGHTPRNFIHGNSQEDIALKATSVIDPTWCAALFNDGSLFINGAFYDKHILKAGKNIGVRLPSLPEGFSYTGFTISGTWLYAAWEETSFYETARSGFLSVDLNQLLYNK